MIFENCFYFLNLLFSMFFFFFITKTKLGTKRVLPVFLIYFDFSNNKQFFKNRNESCHSFWIKMCLVTPKVLAMVVLWVKKNNASLEII